MPSTNSSNEINLEKNVSTEYGNFNYRLELNSPQPFETILELLAPSGTSWQLGFGGLLSTGGIFPIRAHL